MTMKINRAAVLGSGVMGAQIAAHLAAAGVRVHLLDLVSTEAPKDPKLAAAVGKNFRSARSILALHSLKSLKPSPLMSEAVLDNVIPGNFDDDFEVLRDVDWVIEVVVERLDIKQSIHKRIADTVPFHIPVTTNTSGISLADMIKDLPEHYQKRFFGTHFFNPPRYMYLVEIVTHPDADRKIMTDLAQWIEERLGKGIVWTGDTVNFIANRIGVFNIMCTMRHMADLGINIETVDALTGKLMGRPSSATFRTMDVVGLDTFAHVAKNVFDRAPDDPFRNDFKVPGWLAEIIEKGAHGQKTGGVGCFKKSKGEKGETVILAYRPAEKTYAAQAPTEFPWMKDAGRESNLVKRMSHILAQKDAGAELIWRILRDTIAYSAVLLREIAEGQPKAVDDAIRWGFNWEMGPFELWQALGADTLLARMQAEKTPLPDWAKPGVAFYKPSPGSAAFAATGATEMWNAEKKSFVPIKPAAHHIRLPKSAESSDSRKVIGNASATLVDIGDGITCLTFHTKMNAIDMQTIEMIQQSVTATAKNFRGMVVANEGDHFSAGANLKYMLELITKQDYKGIDHMLRQFQGAVSMLKFAPFPTASCPHGMTLGGGCEVALHTTGRFVSGETYAGLVEIGVGLIPAGGGTKELALRCYDFMSLTERGDPMAFISRAFMLIGTARTSTSGQEAIDMGLLPPTTWVSLSRNHQVKRAKDWVINRAEAGYVPATPRTAIKVAGDPGIQSIKLMLYNMVEGRQISPYDAVVGEKVATVLCGGEIDGGQTVSEQFLLDLERRVFVELCHERKTAERIEFMLKNGKPLRN